MLTKDEVFEKLKKGVRIMSEIKSFEDANKRILEILGLSNKDVQSLKIEFTPGEWPAVEISMTLECDTQYKILKLIQELNPLQNQETKPCQE